MHWLPLDMYSLNHFNDLPLNPSASSLGRITSAATVSKAALRWYAMIPTILPSWMPFIQPAWAFPNADVQLLFALNPNWDPGSAWVAARCLSTSSFTMDSMILDMAQRIETGRYEAGSMRDFPCPLYTGKTLPTLKPAGTIPSARLRLTRCARGAASKDTPFLRIEAGMPSIPTASVGPSRLIVLAIFPALAKLNEKDFPLPAVGGQAGVSAGGAPTVPSRSFSTLVL
jgi:hypothetical protein